MSFLIHPSFYPQHLHNKVRPSMKLLKSFKDSAPDNPGKHSYSEIIQKEQSPKILLVPSLSRIKLGIFTTKNYPSNNS